MSPPNQPRLSPARAIGLMSGTSLDGIDAAAVEIETHNGRHHAVLKGLVTLPYDERFRERLRSACENACDVREVARLDAELPFLFAQAVSQVLAQARWRPEEIEVVGSHGQTIAHLPDESATLQIGSFAALATFTAIPCAGDFRSADVARGGQGAPLTPWADWHLFHDASRSRILHNVGGMANLSWLPRDGAIEDVRAWDSGPGCALIDECVRLATHGREHFDCGGAMAARGKDFPAWLRGWEQHPFFQKAPPKSCGREEFGRAFAAQFFDDGLQNGLAPDDIVCNATRLVAGSMARSYEPLQVLAGANLAGAQVLVCGGGALNPSLLAFLGDKTRSLGVEVKRLEEIGGHSEAREAVAFALMAHALMRGETNTLPRVTGARSASRAGCLAWP
jgi:anhydro-N-acetylmuramic acid kinase